MVKKYKRTVVKTTSRMVIIFLFFGTIISTLAYTLIHNLCQVNDLKKELSILEKERNSLLETGITMEADIKRLSDPTYVARYAREKYLYSKEGELILRIEE